MKKKLTINKVIEATLAQLEKETPGTEEFEKLTKALDDLYKVRNLKNSGTRVDKNTMALIGANIFGLLVVLNYERVHVVSSKAFGLVVRGRL